MSENQLEQLLQMLKSDVSLREKLSSAKGNDELTQLLAASGYSLSLDEISKVNTSLSDLELELMSGGNSGDCTAGWGSKCCSANQDPEYCRP